METLQTVDFLENIASSVSLADFIPADFTDQDFFVRKNQVNLEQFQSILTLEEMLKKPIPSWSSLLHGGKNILSPKENNLNLDTTKKEDSLAGNAPTNATIALKTNVSTDSTNSVDINRINEEFYDFLDKHRKAFIWTLKHTDFEDGIENSPIKEVENYIKKNKFVTYSWLNSIFSSNQKDSDVIAALLRIIGMTVDDEDYDKLLPLVKAGLSDNSSKAQEAAIMVIEQWRSKNCLDAIQTASFQSPWIREYAKQVEVELEHELELC